MTDADGDQIKQLLADGWAIHGQSVSTISDGTLVHSTQLQKNDQPISIERIVDSTNFPLQTPNPLSPLPHRRRSFFA